MKTRKTVTLRKLNELGRRVYPRDGDSSYATDYKVCGHWVATYGPPAGDRVSAEHTSRSQARLMLAAALSCAQPCGRTKHTLEPGKHDSIETEGVCVTSPKELPKLSGKI